MPIKDMRVTVEDLTPVQKRLRVEVPAARVQEAIDRAFQLVGQRARLPGFRPGRAPRSVLERMFGEQVRHDVFGRLLEESFQEAVEQHGLAPVGTPNVDAQPPALGEALQYSATLDVRPAIIVGDLAGLEVSRPETAVTGDDLQRVLHRMRESAAQLRPVTERSVVEAGDVVTINVVSLLAGGEPERREGVLVEAGAGSFPLALERQLVGQHRGARLSLRVPYPADYPNPGLAGKTAEFEVEVGDLRQKELPSLDDDFARDHGRCETLAELRERVRVDLEREAARRANQAVREAVLDQALTRHSFDVPSSLVDRRTETLLATLDVRLPEGAGQAQALKELRERVRPSAERQVRGELLLDAIAARDGLAVADDEVDAAVDAIAVRERQAVEKVRSLYQRPEARTALRANLVRDRALTRMVDSARVVPASGGASVAHEK